MEESNDSLASTQLPHHFLLLLVLAQYCRKVNVMLTVPMIRTCGRSMQKLIFVGGFARYRAASTGSWSYSLPNWCVFKMGVPRNVSPSRMRRKWFSRPTEERGSILRSFKYYACRTSGWAILTISHIVYLGIRACLTKRLVGVTKRGASWAFRQDAWENL